MTKPTSKCCNAPLITHRSDEGTGYYTCEKCNKPTDMSNTSTESWRIEFRKLHTQRWDEVVMELDDMFCQWDEYKQEQENFITQTLQKEKQKWADELRMEEKHSFPEPIDLKYYEQGFNKAVQKFNARIEKLIRNKDKSL